jgi:hypothetical protein
MPKRISIEPHLSLDELYRRYRQATTTVERSHYQIVWLLASGSSTGEVAEVTGYNRQWIYELVWGYNRIGPESLGDGRHSNRGAEPLLDEFQQALLWQALSSPPADGGLWNGPKVAMWMSDLLERKVSPQRGWEYLRQMRFRLWVPRPEHEGADLAEQEAWKKNSRSRPNNCKAKTPTPPSKFGVKTSIA